VGEDTAAILKTRLKWRICVLRIMKMGLTLRKETLVTLMTGQTGRETVEEATFQTETNTKIKA